MVGEKRGEGGVIQACGQSERERELRKKTERESRVDRGQRRTVAGKMSHLRFTA